jgi:hypothetical protein
LENVADNLGIDSALGSLDFEDMDNVADVSDAHIASVFRVEAYTLWHIAQSKNCGTRETDICR